MVTFLCSICQEDYPFSTLRCLPCGHAFCAECVERCITVNKQKRDRNGRLKTRFPCPSCRADFKASDPHPIYVENSDFTPQDDAGANGPAPCHTDAIHRRIQSALREVKRTEHDLRRQTVQKAAQEMDRVVEVSDGKDNCLLPLLSAVAERWRGMLPRFSELESQRNEIVTLRNKLREAEEQRDTAVDRTSAAEEIADRAVKTTEQAHDAFRQAKTQISSLELEMQRLKDAHHAELLKKKQEMSRLIDNINALKNKETKQKARIEELREAKEVEQRLREAAESQLVSLDDCTDDDMGGLSQVATHRKGSEEYLYHDYSGSQATVERLSNTGQKRKRKGSEDDLVVLDPGSSLAKDGGSPHSPRRALVPKTRKRPAGAKPFIFTSEWQLSKEQVSNNWKKPKPVSTGGLPLELNGKGKATRPVQLGSRKRLCSRG